ncbi:MAG TPA: hypothetical protein PKZ53_21120, partial [Acidobacteriota bacterium]|nr:hypothetical protein [Acidobacteriota bacterium]
KIHLDETKNVDEPVGRFIFVNTHHTHNLTHQIPNGSTATAWESSTPIFPLTITVAETSPFAPHCG